MLASYVERLDRFPHFWRVAKVLVTSANVKNELPPGHDGVASDIFDLRAPKLIV